jgi:hypothetical protein
MITIENGIGLVGQHILEDGVFFIWRVKGWPLLLLLLSFSTGSLQFGYNRQTLVPEQIYYLAKVA